MAGLGHQYGHPFLDAPVEDVPLHGEVLPHLAEFFLEVGLGKAFLSHKDNTAEEHADIGGSMLRQVEDVSFIRGYAVGYGGYDSALVWTCYSKNI